MRYLVPEEVLLIQAALIERTGGAPGIRDINLFQSILAKPRQAFQGQERYPTVYKKAAVYLQGFAAGQVFVDGNKRIGFTTAARFLAGNGYKLTPTNKEAEQFVLSVVKDKKTVDQVARWIRRHTQRG